MENQQCLFRLGSSGYVQHADGEPLPAQVAEYCRRMGGDLPPYIPLPQGPVLFTIRREGYGTKEALWDGEGPLPQAVMDYVREEGVLPFRRSTVGNEDESPSNMHSNVA